jgi:hypothetical protein
MEVILTLGLLQESRQPTLAEQLCWTNADPTIHHEMHDREKAGSIQLEDQGLSLYIEGASSLCHEPAAVLLEF